MPALNRIMADKELQRMIQLYLKAETDIINEIGRLRSLGLVDYHAEAALARVQAILNRLEQEGWEYVPRFIEREFYVSHPEARKPSARGETPEKHGAGYANAYALTGEQTDIVNRLVMNLMGELVEAHATAYASLSAALIGRVEPDIFRRVGLEQTAATQAMGRGPFRAVPDFVEALRREGVTAFVDKAGRKWSLHTYASMVLRTTSRQAEVLSVLTQNPEWDLYKISRHGTTCKRCAPYEGRVYSKSGRDPEFPALSAAFGKIDPNGPDTLDNTWLNLHPNCLHQILRWTPAGRSEAELKKIKDFSSFNKNPPTRDPRTEKQIEAYRKKEQARARRLASYRQWERYREALGDGVPKTFETFLKHKAAGDKKYKEWNRSYRTQRRLASAGKSDILKDTEYHGIPITDEAIDYVPVIQPDGWTLGRAKRLQKAHRDLLRWVQGKQVGTEAGAVYSPDVKFIERKIGTAGDFRITLPHCDVPHIVIHNHPSGESFSHTDLAPFAMNGNMWAITVVGNSGSVYMLLKTDEYDGFRFLQAYHSALQQIESAIKESDMKKYTEIMENFLEGAGKYGAQFIKRR